MRNLIASLLFFASISSAQIGPIGGGGGTGGGSGNATTINGAAVPQSAPCLGTNASRQPISTSCGGVLPSTPVTMSGNAATFSANQFSVFLVTLTANLTTFTFNSPADGQIYTFVFTQDSTGGRTVSYPASFVPSPAQPVPDASSTTTVQCVWQSSSSKCIPPGTSSPA